MQLATTNTSHDRTRTQELEAAAHVVRAPGEEGLEEHVSAQILTGYVIVWTVYLVKLSK